MFGAGWSVTWLGYSSQARRVRGEAERVFTNVDLATSTWRADSELARLRRDHVSPTLGRVLDIALDVAERSGGALDPTVGPLVDLWRPGRAPRHALPAPEEVARVRARVGWREVERTAEPEGLLVDLHGRRLDLSAVAPGFAADEVSSRLMALDLDDHLVDVGGELRARGDAPRSAGWSIEVETPLEPEVVALSDLGIATSANRYANYSVEGLQVGHIIDPRTGWPTGDEVGSVTVIAPDAAHADAWATALLVLGEAGLTLAAQEGLGVTMWVRRPGGWRRLVSPEQSGP